MRVGAALLLLIATWPPARHPPSLPALPRAPRHVTPRSWKAELLADDQDAFIVQHEEGFVTAVTGRKGYVVRDGETRELVDPSGAVVAREGDLVALGGGMNLDDTAFVVCGPFTVTPAR